MLSVKKYRASEEAGKRKVPNRVVEMVSPVVFASEGYPNAYTRLSYAYTIVKKNYGNFSM